MSDEHLSNEREHGFTTIRTPQLTAVSSSGRPIITEVRPPFGQPVYMFLVWPDRTVHDHGDEDEPHAEAWHLLHPTRDLIATGHRGPGLTSRRSACGFLYPHRMVTRLRHLVDCPECKSLMGLP